MAKSPNDRTWLIAPTVRATRAKPAHAGDADNRLRFVTQCRMR